MATRKSSPTSVGGMDKRWQAESDLSTLARAEEIKKDPKRYKAALDMAKDKIAEFKSVQTDSLEEATEK